MKKTIIAVLFISSVNFAVNPAYSQTLLDPSSIDFSTVGGRANFARFLYFLVAGPSSDYTISGPEAGYVGVINDITGPNALGGGLSSGGYNECSDIPTTGDLSMTDSEGTFAMTFSTGSKVVPSHFGSNAGETYDKRVSVALNGTNFMIAEFKCDSGATIETGYIRMSFPGENFDFETYYQSDSSTNSTYVDFFSNSSATGAEKTATRFQTTDGSTFSLVMARVVDNSNGSIVGVNGTAGGNVTLTMVLDSSASNATSNSTELTAVSNGSQSGTESQFSECIDLSTNAAGTGCSAISDPGTYNLGSGALSFHMQDTFNLTVSDI